MTRSIPRALRQYFGVDRLRIPGEKPLHVIPGVLATDLLANFRVTTS